MSDDSSQEEFELYVNKAEETRQWSALPWGGETLTDTKTRLRLDSLPRVLVFDRNLELITENGADDLLFLSPVSCRNYWIDQLT